MAVYTGNSGNLGMERYMWFVFHSCLGPHSGSVQNTNWTSERRKSSIIVSLSSPSLHFPPCKTEASDVLRYLEKGWKELTQCWNTADSLTHAVILGMSVLKSVFQNSGAGRCGQQSVATHYSCVTSQQDGFALLSFIFTKEKAVTSRECLLCLTCTDFVKQISWQFFPPSVTQASQMLWFNIAP